MIDGLRARFRARWTPESGRILRHRRKAVVATGLVGTGLLGVGLNAPPGSNKFYGLTAATAVTYVVGGYASGEIRSGEAKSKVLVPTLLGIASFAVFYVGGLVCRQIPFARRAITKILGYASGGSNPLVVAVTVANGVAEEIYFRGAVFAAAGGQRSLRTTTGAYVLATVATRNPALVFASGLMGTLWGLQREATGGVQASAITHVVWQLLMLRYLPPLFRPENLPAPPTVVRSPAGS